MLGGERIGEHGRWRILTLFHIFLDICETWRVPSEMVLFTRQEWKFEFLLSFVTANVGFFIICLTLLNGCILLALIVILSSTGF